jgi:transcriptional regulator
MPHPISYGLLPDSENPNTSRGEIHEIAKEKLRAYENAADTWPLYEYVRIDINGYARTGKDCRLCDQTVYFITDDQGRGYSYSHAELRALITSHIRQVHSKLVDDGGL